MHDTSISKGRSATVNMMQHISLADDDNWDERKYRFIRLLGKGGFGATYQALHIPLAIDVAIKLLLNPFTTSDLERFRKEARIAIHLHHRHIVRVLDFTDGEEPLLVMEYASNGTLQHRHPLGTVLPLATVLSYARQIGSALSYMHRHPYGNGFIHRDVKPSNILVGSDHRLLLCDFGITITAREVVENSEIDCFGTVDYMAPEQHMGNPCFASDQYAFAVTIYQWLTGRLPFTGTKEEVLWQHSSALPPSLCALNPEIPYAVEEVVLKALSKEPEQRFETIEAFVLALERASRPPSSTRIAPTRPIPGGRQSTTTQPSALRRTSKARLLWNELARLFAMSVFIGIVVSVLLYALGVYGEIVWFLLSLVLVASPLIVAYVRRKRLLFILSWGNLGLSATAGLLAHSAILFAMIYSCLLLLSIVIGLPFP